MLLRVAACAINQTPFDWVGNESRLLQALRDAKDSGVQVLLFPELSVPGYEVGDSIKSFEAVRRCNEIIKNVAVEGDGMAVILGTPVFYNGHLFNGSVMIVNGKVEGIAIKRRPAQGGLHDELRIFAPWESNTEAKIMWEGEEVRIGDLLFDLPTTNGDVVRVGFEICEDAWVADRGTAKLAGCGVQIILNPSASHFGVFKDKIRRERIVRQGAATTGGAYVYANFLGIQSGRAIYDGGCFICDGDYMVASERFPYQEHSLCIMDIETNVIKTRQLNLITSPIDLNGKVQPVRVAYSFGPPRRRWLPVTERDSWATTSSPDVLRYEEIVRGVSFALFDYLRKSRMQGYLVSLSGGADSSLTTLLVALMVQRGIQQCGVDGFKLRLPHIRRLQQAETEEQVIGILLKCIYQAAHYSTAASEEAAATLANEVFASYSRWSVSEIIEGFASIISDSGALDIDMPADPNDVSVQNLTARARTPALWFVANAEGRIVLNTSNRSEMALGYGTYGGDLLGGYSPLGGIDKWTIMGILQWYQSTGPAEIGPCAILELVTKRPPSAELAPDQEDTKDLMPYEWLAKLEKLAFGQQYSPQEVFNAYRWDADPHVLYGMIEKLYSLWARNQWKRSQLPTAPFVEVVSLDLLNYRFPVFSGGSQKELADLLAQIEQ
jgi:NAD+ synthase (glutamine-hydrolysing)